VQEIIAQIEAHLDAALRPRRNGPRRRQGGTRVHEPGTSGGSLAVIVDIGAHAFSEAALARIAQDVRQNP
jgi:hypothetical protein